MNRPHDLPHLPTWGPYGKVYAGAAHIPDLEAGLRFDLAVVAGFYRGRHEVPNVLWESGYRPSVAAPDLSLWEYQHRLDGEAVRIDHAYAALRASGVDGLAVRIRAVNGAQHAQTFSASLLAGAQFPARVPGDPCAVGPEIQRPGVVRLPAGGVWRSCLDYAAKHPARPHPWDTLQYDGSRWREFPCPGVAGGYATYLDEPGDALTLRLAIPSAMRGARLLVRCRSSEWAGAELVCSGAITGRIRVADPTRSGQWQVLDLGGGDLQAGLAEIRLAHGGPRRRIDLDLVAVVPPGGSVAVDERVWTRVPCIAPGPVADSLLLTWPDLPTTYGLRWFAPRSRVRQWYADRIDTALRERNHDHVNSVLRGRGDGHWSEVLLEPLAVEAASTETVWAMALQGDGAEVSAALARLQPTDLQAAHAAAERRVVTLPSLPAGEVHRAGALAMAACTLTNITYPVRTRGRWIRHYSPGKWWDSLYTWDAGFVGLGLLECDPACAQACLEQYLMPEGDPDCAFLAHGTPLPVQIHLAQALWNRTRDRAALARSFPGLRQMHRFLVGRYGSSDTARLSSGLLNTFSYFYNSGGWDDYAPQSHMHAAGLAGRAAPMANTSHAIRCARILAGFADILGEPRAEFDADAERLTAAVQRCAWDDAESVFSWVLHGEDGTTAPLRHPASGTNFNHGLDGFYPLVAGVCTADQEARLLARLADEGDMLAPCGLTAISQRAAYYRADGYWNGTVWFAHNWFFWRILLDLGQADLAWSIASRALQAWTREVAISGNCYEHFINLTGRGAGWHHFSSLSSPVLSWHSAYYRPGLVSGGYDCWVLAQEASAAQLRLTGVAGRSSTVLVVAGEGFRSFTWEGQPCLAQERHPGCFEVRLPARGEGWLRW